MTLGGMNGAMMVSNSRLSQSILVLARPRLELIFYKDCPLVFCSDMYRCIESQIDMMIIKHWQGKED